MGNRKQWIQSPGIVVVGALLVYLVLYRNMFVLEHQSPATLGNLDLPSFANGAEILLREGFDATGNIVGRVIGPRLRDDTVGTFFFQALLPSLSGRDVWTTTASTLLSALVVMALQLRLLIGKVFGVRPTLAAGLATVAAFTPVTFLALGSGYISQLLGMATLYAGVTVIAQTARRRHVRGLALQLGLVLAAAWFVYPLIALAIPAVGLAVVLLARKPRQWISLVQPIGALLGIAFLASLVLVLNRAPVAVGQIFDQARTTGAGYDLPGLLPHEMVGFTGTLTSPESVSVLAPLGVIPVIALALLVWRNRLHARVVLPAAVAIAALGSYAVIFAALGISYQQWKWASMVAPLLVAASAVVLLRVTPKAIPHKAPALLAICALVFVVNDVRTIGPAFDLNNSGRYITPEMAALANNDRLARLYGFAIDDKRGNEMWIASMFPGKQLDLRNVRYYNAVLSHNPIVLHATTQPLDPTHASAAEAVGKGYELLRTSPSTQARITATSPSTSIAPGDSVDWTVQLTNTGPRAWVSRSEDPHNGLFVDVDVVRNVLPGEAGYIQDPGAVAVVHDDVDTIELPAGARVEPGQTHTFTGTTVVDETNDAFLDSGSGDDYRPGELMLQFDPERENTGAFMLWSRESRIELDVAP